MIKKDQYCFANISTTKARIVMKFYHTKSPYHLASEVPKNMKKTCFDAWNGFHSLELEKKSRPYTKFITHWGA